MRLFGREVAPGAVLDAGLATACAGMVAVAAWGPGGVVGSPIAGPWWLRAVLPLLLGAPLAVRRRAPVLTWLAIWAALSLQALVTWDAPAGPDVMVALFVAGYSLAAYAPVGRASAALAAAVPGCVVYVLASHGARSSAVLTTVGGRPDSARLLFAGEILALWLVGLYVRARRKAASLAARNAELERVAEGAVAAERRRIARELHDIVAHHLSVVVLQAGGARAAGVSTDTTLEKIENSGRVALTEMRRLLDVLREPDETDGVGPPPGIAELGALVDNVHGTGVRVRLVVTGDHSSVPEAVHVSAYRIVQEALTNVLKHAGPAQAEVTVGCVDGAVTIEVTDDGGGAPARAVHPGGQGLIGIRERAAVFGGGLQAGPRPEGGFAVRAWLSPDGGVAR